MGDSIRTTVKFLTQDLFNEREEAISLLYELSKCESLSEKIGAVSGAILILDGLVSSNSEDILTVQKAEKILENLETCEKNVLQMAENGRMQPLVRLLLEGNLFYIFYFCLVILINSFFLFLLLLFSIFCS